MVLPRKYPRIIIYLTLENRLNAHKEQRILVSETWKRERMNAKEFKKKKKVKQMGESTQRMSWKSKPKPSECGGTGIT